MAELLMSELIRVLQQLPEPVNVTAEELCDALWLHQQGVRVETSAARAGGQALGPATVASPYGQVESAHPAEHDQDSVLSARVASHVEDTGDTRASTTRITLRGATALPEARRLSQALRPLRYDPFKIHRADGIDEQATALRIARTGIRDIAWRTTRRRRLDLDLVLDLGGSGPIWRQLAAEIRTMLEIHGAFRSVRCWELDSDSDALPLRSAWIAGRRPSEGVYSERVLFQTPRKPLIVVLTDGAGRGWQSGAVREPLRQCATYGTVLLVHLLPARMWQRTSLAPSPVTFHPTDDGYHSGRTLGIDNAELYEIGLERVKDLPAAVAIPVIGLSSAWLRSWLPLLRGTQAGAVPGYALVIGRKAGPVAGAATVKAPAVDADHAQRAPKADERVQRFLLTASRDAIKLARLLSVKELDLSIMRKVRSRLLPRSEPEVMAEVMLGGLVFWTSSVGTLAPSGTLRLEWHPGVQKLLQARPGGPTELHLDEERVNEAILADDNRGEDISVILDHSGQLANVSGRSATNPEQLIKIPKGMMPPQDDQRFQGRKVARGRDDDDPTVRIGLFGSTQSGRTTFLTILGTEFTRWTMVHRGGGRRVEQWRVVPASPEAELFVEESKRLLIDERRFPDPTNASKKMLFKLERMRARRRRGLLEWLMPEQVAEVTVGLQDRPGAHFVSAERPEEAARYLATSHALAYFFDPTYDEKPRKWHSADFFNAVETDLGMNAATEGRLDKGRLPQHIAVCIPKLDEQRVFNVADDNDWTEVDPINRLPWVPPAKAKRLFERIVAEQWNFEGDYLRMRLGRIFDRKKTTYHALSSVGFWIPEDGEFDPADVCNVIKVPISDPSGGEPDRRVRGTIRPVHVLDPFISLIERATKQTGPS